MQQPTAQRRVQRVRHELRQREVEVVRREFPTPHFVSLTFAGEALADFVSAGFDDHIKFMFQDSDGTLIRRDYTPRHFDREARELTIEFALHSDGKASTWAANAKVGHCAVIGGPRGSMIVPDDFDWQLMIADATGLPAVHRHLQELPAGSRIRVLVHVDKASDRRDFASAANLELQWFSSSAALLDAVAGLQLPQGEGFAWGAGEASVMQQVRAQLLEKGHPKQAMRVAAYWREGQSDYHEELDQ
ncbi:MAG: NADPH-dependent ferric-chelate reductase [Pseudomonas citronellolis]|nr:MAG: NADPH-dependent ferric-chelate reductase [Pseudomonas citronellolis]